MSHDEFVTSIATKYNVDVEVVANTLIRRQRFDRQCDSLYNDHIGELAGFFDVDDSTIREIWDDVL